MEIVFLLSNMNKLLTCLFNDCLKRLCEKSLTTEKTPPNILNPPSLKSQCKTLWEATASCPHAPSFIAQTHRQDLHIYTPAPLSVSGESEASPNPLPTDWMNGLLTQKHTQTHKKRGSPSERRSTLCCLDLKYDMWTSILKSSDWLSLSRMLVVQRDRLFWGEKTGGLWAKWFLQWPKFYHCKELL